VRAGHRLDPRNCIFFNALRNLRAESIGAPIMTDSADLVQRIADDLEIAAMCNPIRNWDGCLWFGRNENFADATFVDHGAATAFINIVKAAPDLVAEIDRLKKALAAAESRALSIEAETREACARIAEQFGDPYLLNTNTGAMMFRAVTEKIATAIRASSQTTPGKERL
jgi:hypothetical protein